MSDICLNCVFWRPIKDHGADEPYRGVCCRYPPVYTTPRETDLQPKTAPWNWCGEFRSKKEN